MKLYHWKPAPNPRRVRIFLAEKGIGVPMQDVGQGFRLTPDYVQRYSPATVPMLELDDGTQIGEAMAICRYFETLHPDPPLMGVNAHESAVIDMWERRAYEFGLTGVAEIFRNTHPEFKNRSLPVYGQCLPQIPGLVERGQWRLRRFFESFDAQLGANAFVAGSQYTVADITALCTIGFAELAQLNIPEEHRNLQRWYRDVSSRASATA
jgi:glutathione S-transferase